MKRRIVVLLSNKLASVLEKEAGDRGVSIDEIIEEKLRKNFGI